MTDYSNIAGGFTTAAAFAGSAASLFVSREAGADPGNIVLNGHSLPGITQSIDARRPPRIERVPIEGRPGAIKIARLLSDAEVEVGQILLSDEPTGAADVAADLATGNFADAIAGLSSDTQTQTAADKLRAVDRFVRRVTEDGRPVVWALDNKTLNAFSVQSVLFLDIALGQINADRIEIALRFLEFEPLVIETISNEAVDPRQAPADGLSPF